MSGFDSSWETQVEPKHVKWNDFGNFVDKFFEGPGNISDDDYLKNSWPRITEMMDSLTGVMEEIGGLFEDFFNQIDNEINMIGEKIDGLFGFKKNPNIDFSQKIKRHEKKS